ncbi:hypothetical protein C2G38_1912626, partial [Gigaspora rosea]
LWARAADSEICHIKTMMIVKSYWQLIKHDHLYKFYKLQIDHLCYILITRVINQQLYQLHLLQQGHYSVPWRKEFKQEWKKLEKKESL